jgi:hypothetical protein
MLNTKQIRHTPAVFAWPCVSFLVPIETETVKFPGGEKKEKYLKIRVRCKMQRK